MSLLQSSSTCWAVAVNDYGTVVSTILALSTFAALFFLVYILHRTLASRTPEGQRRQQNEKRRKKRKQHAKSIKSCGRAPSDRSTVLNETDDAILDGTAAHDNILEGMEARESISEESIYVQSLPPSVRDEHLDSADVSPEASLSLEDAQRESVVITNTQPCTLLSKSAPVNFDDQSSCGSASGRSTPVPSVANELPDSVVSIAKQIDVPNTVHSKAKLPPTVAQPKATSSTSRRQQNRKGKKSANPIESLPPSQPPAPSKRWDALKPQNRTSNRHQRQVPTKARVARDDQLGRFDPAATTLSAPYSTPQRFSASEKKAAVASTNEQTLPFHPSTYSSPSYASAPSMNSSLFAAPVGSYGWDHSSQLFAASPDRHSYHVNTDVPTTSFVSTLNPHSPSWNGSLNATTHVGAGVPIRPPPGLEMTFQHDVPFGCGSSDGGDSAPASPFWCSSILDLYQTDKTFGGGSATSSPFHSAVSSISNPEPDLLFLRNYQGLSLPPNDQGVSLSFRLDECDMAPVPPLVHTPKRHVRENPFASSSDEEVDVDQIEAELQVLGGQMVGSILDF